MKEAKTSLPLPDVLKDRLRVHVVWIMIDSKFEVANIIVFREASSRVFSYFAMIFTL